MQNNNSKLNNSNLNRNSKLKIRNYILYLDTSEPEAVLAIYQGDKWITEEKWLAHRELSATLSQKYSDILANTGIDSGDLEGIAVFVGPGTFTGLRIGISFANGLAFALKIPVYETKKKREFSPTDPRKIAKPFYGAEPNITKPKTN